MRIKRIENGLRPASLIQGDMGWSLQERMAFHGVPGVGIAVIENYQIAWFKVYGKADLETGAKVQPDTLFQAGSISKPMTAYGALKMVQNGQLSLDGNINEQLKRWQLPDNPFAKGAHVSLTHLLSHTGGITVHGFPGYAFDGKLPDVVQILDGHPPANSRPIRVDKKPGESWRYSGGGYTIAQLLLMDVAASTFPELMHELVLTPIGMDGATFVQPLSPMMLEHAAAGVEPDRRPVYGKRLTYPELAAAGLWATAKDLARFAIEVQQALKGEGKVLTRQMAEMMLEPIVPDFCRGFALKTRDGHTYFSHRGWNKGFCSQITAHRHKGYGIAVMINSNHPAFIDEILRGVALEYHWAGYPVFQQAPIPEDLLEGITGRYRFSTDQAFLIYRVGNQLFMQYYGWQAWELIHIGGNRFVRREREAVILLTKKGGEPVFNFVLANGDTQSYNLLKPDERVPRQLLMESDYKFALDAYRRLKEKKDANSSESFLNNQGINLVNERQFDAAIAIFRIACDLYPTSANTWDRLGFAYNTKGDKVNAIKYYRKALRVSPGSGNAETALKKLENR